MEVTSTGDFISRVDTINKTDIPIEEIDLEEIDEHLERQAKEAQERYDNFEKEQLGDKILPDGWKAADADLEPSVGRRAGTRRPPQRGIM